MDPVDAILIQHTIPSTSIFYAWRDRVETAGLRPASLGNLVSTLLEPLGAWKDKPHLPLHVWEEQGSKGTWIPFVSSCHSEGLACPEKGLRLTCKDGRAGPA